MRVDARGAELDPPGTSLLRDLAAVRVVVGFVIHREELGGRTTAFQRECDEDGLCVWQLLEWLEVIGVRVEPEDDRVVVAAGRSRCVRDPLRCEHWLEELICPSCPKDEKCDF